MTERVLFGPGGATEAKQDDAIAAIEALDPLTDVQLRAAPLDVTNVSALVPVSYDAVLLDPPDQPGTIQFFQGGLSGTVVATLSLTYDGTDLVSVVRI